MINRHVRVVEQTEAHQCLLPLVGLHGHKAAHKQIVDNGATGEIIVGPDALDTLLSDSDYAELTQEMAATGRFSLFQYDGDIPYFVGVLDDVVQIGVDDDGTPRALLESQRSQVRAWAEDTFEEYKRLATPVTISEESTKARA
jgi:predicted transcriptional regulator